MRDQIMRGGVNANSNELTTHRTARTTAHHSDNITESNMIVTDRRVGHLINNNSTVPLYL